MDCENKRIASVVCEDARLIEEFLNIAEVKISESAYFTGSMAHIDGMGAVLQARRERSDDELRADPSMTAHWLADTARAYTAWHDFSHTAPDWENVYALGLRGLLARLERATEREGLSEQQREYYASGIRAWSAALRYIERMAEQARAMGKTKMADGIEALTRRPPETLYEAMQLTFLFYDLQQHIERTVLRTLGHLDELYWNYYMRDLAEGRLTVEQAEQMMDEFLLEWDSRRVLANIPFSMGGIAHDGSVRLNELSYLMLRRFVALGCPNVKLHILWDEKLPRDFVQMALQGIRAGHNSIVFLNDARVIESLARLGMDLSDAERYEVVGCYEPCAKGEVPCSCNGRINLPLALESVLFGGRILIDDVEMGRSFGMEFADFDALLEAFLEQVRVFCRSCMEFTNVKERQYPRLHSAPFFSSAYDVCVEQGGDVYCDYVAKYNNSSLNLVGLATAIDALMAIRTLVYEEKALTLDALREILKNNWEGQDALRARALRNLPKYGVSDPLADALAQTVLSVASEEINGKPNVKGGVYRLGGFSIDWRLSLGRHTAATAGGRLSGEPISKNLCAEVGADREGATALILSVASLDGNDMPNGSVLDVVLHSSAVSGESGMIAFSALLETYMRAGGMAVQFNVLDTGVLREAQKNPELYPNLQVRLCGWNVLFSSLSREEQDEFIRRSEVGA